MVMTKAIIGLVLIIVIGVSVWYLFRKVSFDSLFSQPVAAITTAVDDTFAAIDTFSQQLQEDFNINVKHIESFVGNASQELTNIGEQLADPFPQTLRAATPEELSESFSLELGRTVTFDESTVVDPITGIITADKGPTFELNEKDLAIFAELQKDADAVEIVDSCCQQTQTQIITPGERRIR